MSSPIDKSVELFMSGYNCAQSIVGGFCDEVGLDFDTAIKISLIIWRWYGQIT